MTTRHGGAVRIQIILWTCFLLVGPASQPLLGQASRDVTESMVGHKLGEFAPTRTFRSHAGQERGGLR